MNGTWQILTGLLRLGKINMLEYIRGKGWVEMGEMGEKIITFKCGTVARVERRNPVPGEAWDIDRGRDYSRSDLKRFITDYLIEGCTNGRDTNNLIVFVPVG